jgi:methionine-rich copper-binding protein CopC
MGWLWVVIVYLALLAPSTVSAHAYLVKSIPARRAILFKAPTRLQLWFNEKLEPRFSFLTVTDSNGTRVDLGDIQVDAEDPKQLSVEIKPLPPGIYTVEFRVLSVDGHVVKDQFSFTVRARR